MIGKTLSHYEVTAKLGEGGMGTVYRATDANLGREVAIKVLKEGFAGNPDRLSRFAREAKVLASINHPNIATLYDFDTQGEVQFIVMELVEGESLADRIDRGPILMDEALKLFHQLADGLEGAHAKGVMHRDLKPANIQVSDGHVKILDFGLARLLAQDDPSEDPSQVSTASEPLTDQGRLIGTVPYMSPEQARGESVDAQTDIWAFGCCLFEACTGQRAFSGRTTSELVAKILESEPDWEELQISSPERISELVFRCLQKEPRDRLHSIADARIEIESAAVEKVHSELVPSSEGKARGRRARFVGVALGAVVVLTAIVLGMAWRGRSKPEGKDGLTPRVLSVLPPPGVQLWAGVAGSLDVSPDGKHIVFVGQVGSGDLRLYYRSFGASESVPLPGTEGGHGPFFSVDGRWVAFEAHGQLKKVSIEGGHPVVVCESLAYLGGTWLEDDSIVFTDVRSLLRVPAAGGVPEVIATADVAQGEHFRSPGALPGDQHVLVTAANNLEAQVVAVSLEDGDRTELLRGEYPYARYAPPGYLLYGDGGSLFVTQFDARELRVRGSGSALGEGIGTSQDGTGALFAVSREGTLVYAPRLQEDTQRHRRLVWRYRDGVVETLPVEPRWYSAPRLSPQGTKLAITVIESSRSYDVWIYDLLGGAPQRLTVEGNNDSAVWSPDGSRLAFVSFRDGPANLYVQSVEGGEAHLIPPPAEPEGWELYRFPSSWSPDGRLIAFHQLSVGGHWDILVAPVNGDGVPRAFADTPANEFAARFSPDGAWIAYVSDESGREEVYVQPYPPTGGEWQISDGGGVFPVWSFDGNAIFYVDSDDSLLTVTVQTERGFVQGNPEALFDDIATFFSSRPLPEFDVAADGERFLTWETEPVASSTWSFAVILDWPAHPRLRTSPDS